MAIRLDCIESIPTEILRELEKIEPKFRSSEFLDEVLQDPQAFAVVGALQQHVEESGFVGFHYTRAFPKHIRAEGLTACSGSDRRRRFLVEFGSRFNSEQRGRMCERWRSYFGEQQNTARDHRVFFAGSDNLNLIGSVGYLYGFYGGEAVNMPLTEESDIMAILAEIGRPLVVSCALDPSDLRPPYNNDYGRALVSAE